MMRAFTLNENKKLLLSIHDFPFSKPIDAAGERAPLLHSLRQNQIIRIVMNIDCN